MDDKSGDTEDAKLACVTDIGYCRLGQYNNSESLHGLETRVIRKPKD